MIFMINNVCHDAINGDQHDSLVNHNMDELSGIPPENVWKRRRTSSFNPRASSSSHSVRGELLTQRNINTTM